MSLRHLVRWSGRDLRLLTFGFLLTLFSSFGQTFFIGLFGDQLRTAAGLGHGSFGTVYSGATLASAVAVFWAGALIDRVPLSLYVTGSASLLAAGCLLLPLGENLALLGLALFLLRFGGQGLLSHTAVTSIARFFERARGRALSVVLLGHPAGEAVLPATAVFVSAALGWRGTWVAAAAVMVAAIPILLVLCRAPKAGHDGPVPGGSSALPAVIPRPGKSRREVLRDRRFHLLLPTLMLPGFIVTGVFIHQVQLVEEKGWTLAWFTSAFMVFAAAQVVGTLAAGPLADRFGAVRLMTFYLVPLAAACVSAASFDAVHAAFLFMAGAGLTTSAAATVVTAALAETYGTTHLGAIRALAVSTMVMSTALAPALFGWLLDLGVGFDALLLGAAASILCAIPLARRAVSGGDAIR